MNLVINKLFSHGHLVPTTLKNSNTKHFLFRVVPNGS